MGDEQPASFDDFLNLIQNMTEGRWYIAPDRCIYVGQNPDADGECHDVLVADTSCDGSPRDQRGIVALANLRNHLLQVVRAAESVPHGDACLASVEGESCYCERAPIERALRGLYRCVKRQKAASKNSA